MIVNNTFYKYYPKIRQEDIGKNTSNMFVDTMQISNLYLKGIGGKSHHDCFRCKIITSLIAGKPKSYDMVISSQAFYNEGSTTIERVA